MSSLRRRRVSVAAPPRDIRAHPRRLQGHLADCPSQPRSPRLVVERVLTVQCGMFSFLLVCSDFDSSHHTKRNL